jgi:hypothetical protein
MRVCCATIGTPAFSNTLQNTTAGAMHPKSMVVPAHSLPRVQPGDAADARTLRHRELLRIDDEALRDEGVVERTEFEARVAGHVEGDDDRRLQLIREQGPEPELAHPAHQNRAALRVSGVAPRYARNSRGNHSDAIPWAGPAPGR